MKVVALQQFVRSLSTPLGALGAAQKILTDIDKIAQALEPFKDFDFEQFVTLLVQAEEYSRTGQLPVPTGKTRATREPKAKKAPPPSVQELAQQMKQMEEKAVSADVSRESLEEELSRLGLDKLTISSLRELAQEVGAEAKAKKKDDLIRSLKRVVLERKESVESLLV
jgi:hypothetical protein